MNNRDSQNSDGLVDHFYDAQANQLPLSLELIEQDVESLNPVLEIVKVYEPEPSVFVANLSHISEVMESFGEEKIRTYFLFLNEQIITGQLELNNLPSNILNFLNYSYYCYTRLADQFPAQWAERSNSLFQQRYDQLINVFGSTFEQIYSIAVYALGGQEYSEYVKERAINTMIRDLLANFSYKFEVTKPYAQIVQERIDYYIRVLPAYIQEIISHET